MNLLLEAGARVKMANYDKVCQALCCSESLHSADFHSLECLWPARHVTSTWFVDVVDMVLGGLG